MPMPVHECTQNALVLGSAMLGKRFDCQAEAGLCRISNRPLPECAIFYQAIECGYRWACACARCKTSFHYRQTPSLAPNTSAEASLQKETAAPKGRARDAGRRTRRPRGTEASPWNLGAKRRTAMISAPSSMHEPRAGPARCLPPTSARPVRGATGSHPPAP